MAINISFLDESKAQDKTTEFSYSDLSLDFKLSSDIKNTPVNRSNNKQDVELLYDEEAIFQSIRNIFNTKPGEKILDPEFGLDLSQFLFYPINEDTGNLIGDTIKRLPIYEPRVTVENIDITGSVSKNEYTIELSVVIPTLNNKKELVKGVLDLDGFRYN